MTSVGDEGGFAPNLETNEQALELILEAIDRAGYRPAKDIWIGLDCAASQFLEGKIKEYRLEDRVKLFGFMPASEVLKGFDIFALPSLKEGLPYVLLEAKQARLPIEASHVGGIPEILDAQDMSEFTLEKMVDKTVEVYKTTKEI